MNRLLKEENEDEEDDEMYNYCNNTMPYEDGNMELENDKSSLLEWVYYLFVN